ncbi:MAG: hypothetical protein ACI9WC_003464, partial [Arenicella sp.]
FAMSERIDSMLFCMRCSASLSISSIIFRLAIHLLCNANQSQRHGGCSVGQKYSHLVTVFSKIIA